MQKTRDAMQSARCVMHFPEAVKSTLQVSFLYLVQTLMLDSTCVGSRRACTKLARNRNVNFKMSRGRRLPSAPSICARHAGRRRRRSAWLTVGYSTHGRRTHRCQPCGGPEKPRMVPGARPGPRAYRARAVPDVAATDLARRTADQGELTDRLLDNGLFLHRRRIFRETKEPSP